MAKQKRKRKRPSSYVRQRMGGWELVSTDDTRHLMKWEIEQCINYFLGWQVDKVKTATEYALLIAEQIKDTREGAGK